MAYLEFLASGYRAVFGAHHLKNPMVLQISERKVGFLLIYEWIIGKKLNASNQTGTFKFSSCL